MDKQETTDWYDKRRKVLNKKIIKLTGMQYEGDSLYSTKICDYQIDDFYDFYSDQERRREMKRLLSLIN